MNNQVQILGNRIDCFSDYKQLYTRILSDRKQRAVTGYVTINNVHTMMEGYWNASYQQIINNSYLSIPDGKPLQVIEPCAHPKQHAAGDLFILLAHPSFLLRST